MEVTPINEKLKTLINNPKIADVKFLVGRNKIEMYGHKTILAISSIMWKNMFFTGNWGEVSQKNEGISQVVIPDLEPKAFLAILRFSYLREIELDPEITPEILYAADKFDMKELKQMCLKFIVKTFTTRTALFTLEKSIKFKQRELIGTTIHYIERKSKTIFSRDKLFNKISEQTIEFILQSNNLFISEQRLFQLLVSRGKYLCLKRKIKPTPKNMKKVLGNLPKLIRLDLLGISGLKEIYNSQMYDLEMVFKRCLEIADKYENQVGSNSEKSRKMLVTREKLTVDQINVLVLVSETREQYKRDVINSIKHQGISQVTSMDVSRRIPTLEEIKNYDSIFVFSCDPFKDPVEMGDLLADYVETNRGLVICSIFALENGEFGRNLKGRIVNDGFLPIMKGRVISHQESHIGEVEISEHPIMKEVTSFNGGKFSYRIDATNVQTGSSVIARYEDGNILIAENRKEDDFGAVVVLNLWPISDEISTNGNYWLTSTDGAMIIANTVQYASTV
ncbi:btb/poz domain-containing [Anaeramoeba flamelloides]|uniref:Btb/poz domain-containing n=1 Tax=Anaeramoeba flamelloides TaxID=1746091 RepID=A0ABQ8YRH4_9EUKA|nr:btb/poz domain-containing [Anaeramoeba flamelloides]